MVILQKGTTKRGKAMKSNLSNTWQNCMFLLINRLASNFYSQNQLYYCSIWNPNDNIRIKQENKES
jgi:hypothetical protein